MPTTIRSHHVDITDPIRDYVNKKMSKLEKFATSIMDIIVDLDVEGVFQVKMKANCFSIN